MAILLALQTCALFAFFIGQGEMLGRLDQRVLTIALVAWTAMELGTAAEFWLYSDLPYGEINMRMTAFSLFFMSSLIAGLALPVLALRLSKTGILSRLFRVVLILYLPIFIALFFAGPSIFVAPALASIAIAGLAVRSKSKSDITGREAA